MYICVYNIQTELRGDSGCRKGCDEITAAVYLHRKSSKFRQDGG